MEFSEILAQLRRWWWLAVLGVLATGGLAYGATLAVAVQYTAESSLVLIPPRTTTDAPANPFLAIGGLNPAADVLVRSLNTGTFHDQHTPAGTSMKYTVARDTDASGPLLVVDASAASPKDAMDLLDAVVREAPVRLAQLQTDVGVQDSVAIRITEIARVAAPKTDSKSQTRAMVAVAVVGLAGTVLLVRLVDTLAARRVRRPRRPTAPAAPTAPAPAAETTEIPVQAHLARGTVAPADTHEAPVARR